MELISLRQLTGNDLEKVRLHRNDPETNHWLENQRPISEEGQAKWFRHGGHKSFRIIMLGDEDIGLARVRFDEQVQCTSVGLDIFKEHRGVGLGERAFREVIREGVSYSRMLDLWVFWSNVAAVKIYMSYGFEVDTASPAIYYHRYAKRQLGFYPYVRMTKSLESIGELAP